MLKTERGGPDFSSVNGSRIAVARPADMHTCCVLILRRAGKRY